ncbi:helix-turn-helix domain-containing protein [uncultured Sphingomonas sp.]|uniref:helix-turn-helix domain-containing protein n=1 Tax=uncultured Sphingomonas sp. TaxID=158754 RepID=UPI0035CA2704
MSEFKTPGQLIESLLSERGWSQRTLAIIIGKGETAITKIVLGKQSLDAETALLLEEVFGVKAERFLALQRDFDLAIARASARPDPKRANRAHIFGGLPVGEMSKRGWLGAVNVRDVKQVEGALAGFFGAESAEEIEFLPHAARKTMVNTETTPAQLAWLYRVRSMAAEMLVPPYSPGKLDEALAELSPLRVSAENVRLVPRILERAGIRFVAVETLPTAKIDGVCFWLDDRAPVVGLSLRHDRNDNFWFVLRHELEHVRLRHGKGQIILDTELDGERAGEGPNVPEEERLANRAGAEFCVPQAQMKAFVDRKAPLFSERDMVGFARSIGVHPGLVAGQLQHITGRYERFRQHLEKVRKYILPTAYVDGWGNVAPVGE